MAEQMYGDVLSVPTLMGLLADYSSLINATNDAQTAEAFANGQLGWDDAFVFGLPKALLLAEVNRMAAWCLAHEAACDAAMLDCELDAGDDQ